MAKKEYFMKLRFLMLSLVMLLVLYFVAYFQLGKRYDMIGLFQREFVIRSYRQKWQASIFVPAAFVESFISHRSVGSRESPR
jgi:hypothetical protein